MFISLFTTKHFFRNILIYFLDACTRIYINLKFIQKYTNGKNEFYLYIMMNIQLIIITAPSPNTYVLIKKSYYNIIYLSTNQHGTNK